MGGWAAGPPVALALLLLACSGSSGPRAAVEPSVPAASVATVAEPTALPIPETTAVPRATPLTPTVPPTIGDLLPETPDRDSLAGTLRRRLLLWDAWNDFSDDVLTVVIQPGHPDALEAAEALVTKYGDDVRVWVGHIPYPSLVDAPCGTFAYDLPDVPRLDSVVIEPIEPDPIVVAQFSPQVVLRNLTGEEVTMGSGWVRIRNGDGQVVATAWQQTVEGGVLVNEATGMLGGIPALGTLEDRLGFSRASCVASLGFMIPSGQYTLEATYFVYDQYAAPREAIGYIHDSWAITLAPLPEAPE